MNRDKASVWVRRCIKAVGIIGLCIFSSLIGGG